MESSLLSITSSNPLKILIKYVSTAETAETPINSKVSYFISDFGESPRK